MQNERTNTTATEAAQAARHEAETHAQAAQTAAHEGNTAAAEAHARAAAQAAYKARTAAEADPTGEAENEAEAAAEAAYEAAAAATGGDYEAAYERMAEWEQEADTNPTEPTEAQATNPTNEAHEAQANEAHEAQARTHTAQAEAEARTHTAQAEAWERAAEHMRYTGRIAEAEEAQAEAEKHRKAARDAAIADTDPATLLGWAYRVASHPAVYTDSALLASAEARIARFEAGTYLQVDVQGLLDWADAEGWR